MRDIYAKSNFIHKRWDGNRRIAEKILLRFKLPFSYRTLHFVIIIAVFK